MKSVAQLLVVLLFVLIASGTIYYGYGRIVLVTALVVLAIALIGSVVFLVIAAVMGLREAAKKRATQPIQTENKEEFCKEHEFNTLPCAACEAKRTQDEELKALRKMTGLDK